MKKLLVVLFASLAVLISGCGGDDAEDGGGNGAATTQEQIDTTAEGDGGEEAVGNGKTVAVDMKDFDFIPEHITIAAGETVRWTNRDHDPYNPHTVTKERGPGPDFDSGRVEPGETYEQTFEEPGKIEYTCVLHPAHEGTVTVE